MTATKAKVMEIPETPVLGKRGPLFKMYKVRWNFLTSLCSSVPANPEMVQAWINARKPDVQPPGGRTIAEVHEEILTSLPEQETPEEQVKKNLLVFQRHGGNLVERAATVRAHIKDCARIISREYVGKIKGELSWSKRLIDCTYLDSHQYWLPILNQETGKPFTSEWFESLPDNQRFHDKAIHLWNGSALKRFEFIHNARIEFTMKVLAGNISREDYEVLFTYAGVHGYAGERGDGEGKYDFEITEL